MVNHDQKRVKAAGRWKVSDEITGDLLERASGNKANGSEGENSGICIGLILLANYTPINIFADKSCKTRPPELGGNQLASF